MYNTVPGHVLANIPSIYVASTSIISKWQSTSFLTLACFQSGPKVEFANLGVSGKKNDVIVKV